MWLKNLILYSLLLFEIIIAGEGINRFKIFWYSLLFHLYLLNKIFCAVGDRCKPNADVTEGTCKSVMDCEIAIRSVNEWYPNNY